MVTYKEIRENGNFNQITLEGFENDCVYYWKVVAKSIIRQNQFEIDSLGGPYAFKTAVRDALSKENLNLTKSQNLTCFILSHRNTLNSGTINFRKIASVVDYKGDKYSNQSVKRPPAEKKSGTIEHNNNLKHQRSTSYNPYKGFNSI